MCVCVYAVANIYIMPLVKLSFYDRFMDERVARLVLYTCALVYI